MYFEPFNFFNILFLIKFVGFNPLRKFDILRYTLKKINKKDLKSIIKTLISQHVHG